MAHKDPPSIHLINRLRMIDAIAMQAPNDAEIICMLGDLRKEVADHHAALSARSKGLNGRQEWILCHFASRHHHAKTVRKWLTLKAL